MAEEKLRTAVEQIPEYNKEVKTLLDKIGAWFKKQDKFAEIKIGDKTFSYLGETFGAGVEIKDCPDGEYETDTHKVTVKAGKVIDYKPKETSILAPIADFSAQFEAQKKDFDLKLASQKSDFEKQVTAMKEAFDKKFDELLQGKLKEMFELIEKIAALPSADSQFKKKDGEPAVKQDETRLEKLKREAKELSLKTFQN